MPRVRIPLFPIPKKKLFMKIRFFSEAVVFFSEALKVFFKALRRKLKSNGYSHFASFGKPCYFHPCFLSCFLCSFACYASVARSYAKDACLRSKQRLPSLSSLLVSSSCYAWRSLRQAKQYFLLLFLCFLPLLPSLLPSYLCLLCKPS